jgi:hypothetical protein
MPTSPELPCPGRGPLVAPARLTGRVTNAPVLVATAPFDLLTGTCGLGRGQRVDEVNLRVARNAKTSVMAAAHARASHRSEPAVRPL